MNWSTNKPKKPGWYWWRPLSTDAPTLVEITLEKRRSLESWSARNPRRRRKSWPCFGRTGQMGGHGMMI